MILFGVNVLVHEESRLVIADLKGPVEFTEPEMKNLPQPEGDLLMCLATAMKQIEVITGKHGYSFQGHINDKKIIDRPVKPS